MGLSTISAPEISARLISARMFHQGNISAHAPFGAGKVLAHGRFNMGTFRFFDTGTFRHEEFSAQEHFTCTVWRWESSGTWKFQHGNVSTFCHWDFSAGGIFSTRTFRHVLKIPRADSCQNLRFRNGGKPPMEPKLCVKLKSA